jgi:hypothetical protein
METGSPAPLGPEAVPALTGPGDRLLTQTLPRSRRASSTGRRSCRGWAPSFPTKRSALIRQVGFPRMSLALRDEATGLLAAALAAARGLQTAPAVMSRFRPLASSLG